MKTIFTDNLEDTNITLQKGEELTYVALIKDGWDETKHLRFNFEGEESKLNFVAVILGTEKNRYKFETHSNHKAPQTNAYYYVRGAMSDSSEVDYVGHLNIKEGAQLTDSYLAHHTLMLSDKARTRTIPSLEIEADDVKAGHAATVGQIEEDTLFYLESRGVPRKQAQQMLIKGFLQADLAKIDDKATRDRITQEIENSLT